MTASLRKVEEILPSLSRGEKAQLLQWVISDLGGVFPGIEKTPGVSGGEACIARTRIPVWLLVQQRNLGISEEQMLHDYPTISAEDINNAWNYYRAHKEELDEEIFENENA